MTTKTDAAIEAAADAIVIAIGNGCDITPREAKLAVLAALPHLSAPAAGGLSEHRELAQLIRNNVAVLANTEMAKMSLIVWNAMSNDFLKAADLIDRLAASPGGNQFFGTCEDPRLIAAGYKVCGSGGDTSWHWQQHDGSWHDGFSSESAAVNDALRDLASTPPASRRGETAVEGERK